MKLTETTVLCSLCLEDIDTEEPFKATHNCQDCSKNLCDGHIVFHKSKKSTKNHILKPLETTITSNNLSVHKNKHYCKQHQDHLFELFCKDCDIIICLKCAVFNHKLHNYVDLNDIVKEEQENVNKLLNNLNFKKEILLERNKDLELTITKINEQIELNKKQIILHFDDLQKELNNKKELLLLDLNNVGQDKLNCLQNEKQIIEKYYNNVNNLSQLESLNNIDILQNKLILENEINNLNKLNVLNNLNEIVEFKINLENNKNILNKLITKIEKQEIKNNKYLFNSLQNEIKLINKFEAEDYELSLEDIIYFNNFLYVADSINNRILILNNLLEYINEIQLQSSPLSLTLNNEYLFVGCENNFIYKYNLKTLQLKTTIKSNQHYLFDSIYSITTDKDNNLFICNYEINEIIILNKYNKLIRKFKIYNNLNPKTIKINNNNQIVIICRDEGNSEIQIYDKLGNFILNVEFGQLNLWGIFCDHDNYIVCDRDNGSLLYLDNNFNIKNEFKNNLIINPIGIAGNNENNEIYIAEDSAIKSFKIIKQF